MATVEGKTIKVGMSVGFKSDVEQYGTVKAIEGDWLILESKYGFSGDYIGGMKETRQHVSDCWID